MPAPVVLIVPVVKRPGETKDFAINWAPETFNYWQKGAEYAINSRVRPRIPNGFELQATQGGQSNGFKEPSWPGVAGATVTDGSIIWTVVAVSTAGLRKQIQLSAFAAENASITLSGDTSIVTAATQASVVKIAGGLTGEVWDVPNHVIFDDGTALDAILRVTIKDGAD